MPALLLAVVFAMGLSAALFVVGRAADQSTRTRSAADAAALAAGTEAGERLRGALSADPHGLLHLPAAPSHFWGDVQNRASTYSEANGSELTDLSIPSFDPASGTWTFQVTVRANDEVSGQMAGISGVHAQSVARAALTVSNLCSSGPGFGIHLFGGCLTPGLYDLVCAPPPPPPPPPPSPAPSGSPSPSPSPTVTVPALPPLPAWLNGHGCPSQGLLRSRLTPTVRLVS